MVAVAGKPRRHQRALLVFRFAAGGCSRPRERRGVSSAEMVSIAETTRLYIDLILV